MQSMVEGWLRRRLPVEERIRRRRPSTTRYAGMSARSCPPDTILACRGQAKALTPPPRSGEERVGHVTTSGSVRPVCRSIPAIASAAAIRSPSISGVSRSRSPPTGS